MTRISIRLGIPLALLVATAMSTSGQAFPVGIVDIPADEAELVIRVQSTPALTPACEKRRNGLMARQSEVDAIAAGSPTCANLKKLAKIQEDAGRFFQQCVPGGSGTANDYLSAAHRTRAQISDTYAGKC